jgi:hypothetical protein
MEAPTDIQKRLTRSSSRWREMVGYGKKAIRHSIKAFGFGQVSRAKKAKVRFSSILPAGSTRSTHVGALASSHL